MPHTDKITINITVRRVSGKINKARFIFLSHIILFHNVITVHKNPGIVNQFLKELIYSCKQILNNCLIFNSDVYILQLSFSLSMAWSAKK